MLSSLNIRHMRVFVAVADQGNFTAASAALGVAASAITATIRQFEDVTGAALFDRTTRNVSLTATGERFLPIARRLIGDFEEALGDLDALSKGVGGKITIAAAPSVLTRIFPAVISQFIADHPDARIRLDELNAGEVHDAVAANQADFGIAGEWQTMPDIRFSPLFSDRFGVLCRDDHRFARHSVLRWSDLLGERLVGLGPESGTGAMMAQPGLMSDLSSESQPVLPPAVRQAASLGIKQAKTVLATAQKAHRAEQKVLRAVEKRLEAAPGGTSVAQEDTAQREMKSAGENTKKTTGKTTGKNMAKGTADGSARTGSVPEISLGATGPAMPRPIVETSNTLTLAAMVAEGVGITVLPELAAKVSEMTRHDGLVFVPLIHPERQRHIGVITRKSKSLSPIARLFLTQVLAEAPKLNLPASLTWHDMPRDVWG